MSQGKTTIRDILYLLATFPNNLAPALATVLIVLIVTIGKSGAPDFSITCIDGTTTSYDHRNLNNKSKENVALLIESESKLLNNLTTTLCGGEIATKY